MIPTGYANVEWAAATGNAYAYARTYATAARARPNTSAASASRIGPLSRRCFSSVAPSTYCITICTHLCARRRRRHGGGGARRVTHTQAPRCPHLRFHRKPRAHDIGMYQRAVDLKLAHDRVGLLLREEEIFPHRLYSHDRFCGGRGEGGRGGRVTRAGTRNTVMQSARARAHAWTQTQTQTHKHEPRHAHTCAGHDGPRDIAERALSDLRPKHDRVLQHIIVPALGGA